MKQKARADAENIVRHAERDIALETSRAIQKVRQEAVDISIAIASKIIQRNLSKEDNERLIADTLEGDPGDAAELTIAGRPDCSQTSASEPPIACATAVYARRSFAWAAGSPPARACAGGCSSA